MMHLVLIVLLFVLPAMLAAVLSAMKVIVTSTMVVRVVLFVMVPSVILPITSFFESPACVGRLRFLTRSVCIGGRVIVRRMVRILLIELVPIIRVVVSGVCVVCIAGGIRYGRHGDAALRFRIVILMPVRARSTTCACSSCLDPPIRRYSGKCAGLQMWGS